MMSNDVHHSTRQLLTSGLVPKGHPIEEFVRENDSLRDIIHSIRHWLTRIRNEQPSSQRQDTLTGLRGDIAKLMDVEDHYLRKEGALFPKLEERGVTGPSTIMWGEDDQVRVLLNRLSKAVVAACERDVAASVDLADLAEQTETSLLAVERVINREERDLLSLAWDTLNEQDWGDVWRELQSYSRRPSELTGDYCPPPVNAGASDMHAPFEMVIDTGRVTAEQLSCMLKVLPLDLTFVDADDRVRFFSLGRDPVFPRLKSDLGNKVQTCHPSESVPLVDRVLSDLRSGKHSSIDSWIHHQQRYLHIRYFAVCNDAGEYLGALEMVQDITHLQGLSGEVRLAQYQDGPDKPSGCPHKKGVR